MAAAVKRKAAPRHRFRRTVWRTVISNGNYPRSVHASVDARHVHDPGERPPPCDVARSGWLAERLPNSRRKPKQAAPDPARSRPDNARAEMSEAADTRTRLRNAYNDIRKPAFGFSGPQGSTPDMMSCRDMQHNDQIGGVSRLISGPDISRANPARPEVTPRRRRCRTVQNRPPRGPKNSRTPPKENQPGCPRAAGRFCEAARLIL